MSTECCSFEQSKKLHRLGVKCCSKWSWICFKDGSKCLIETKEIKDCEECYPALCLEECILILKKCHGAVSWKKEKEFISIDIAGPFPANVRIGKEQWEKDKDFNECDAAICAILHLLECGEIDCDYICCLLRKCTGYCYGECKEKDCKPEPKDDCCEKVLCAIKEASEKSSCEHEQILCAIAELRKECCDAHDKHCHEKEKHEHHGDCQPPHHPFMVLGHCEMPPKKDECCDDLKKELHRLKKELRGLSDDMIEVKTTLRILACHCR